MTYQFVSSNDEFPQRRVGFQTCLTAVEGIHDQLAIHLHGIRLAFFIEVNSPAKTTHAGLSGLVQYRVRPDRQDFAGHLGHAIRIKPAVSYFQMTTAAGHQADSNQHNRKGNTSCLLNQSLAPSTNRRMIRRTYHWQPGSSVDTG